VNLFIQFIQIKKSKKAFLNKLSRKPFSKVFFVAKFMIILTYLLVEACGYQPCQLVEACVTDGESLIIAAVNTMVSLPSLTYVNQ